MKQTNNELITLFRKFLSYFIVKCVRESYIEFVSNKSNEYENNVQYYYRWKINDLISATNHLQNDNKKLNSKKITTYLNRNYQLIRLLENDRHDIEDLIFKLQKNIDEIYLIYKKRGYSWKI